MESAFGKREEEFRRQQDRSPPQDEAKRAIRRAMPPVVLATHLKMNSIEWGDEAHDKDAGAIGRAKGMVNKGDGKAKGKGRGGNVVKGEFSGKCDWCQKVCDGAGAYPKKGLLGEEGKWFPSTMSFAGGFPSFKQALLLPSMIVGYVAFLCRGRP